MKKFNKLDFKTRLRYVILGKRPLERKSLPKVVEYLYLNFSNFIICLIMLAFALHLFLNKEKVNGEFVLDFLNKPFSRLLISVVVISWLIQIMVFVHILYILDKTETLKWVGISACLLGIVGLWVISIPFAIVAYMKNEIAFE
ncbi:hypothetical protein [Mycoplasmopsis alligatoris]|uniref:hypothetical protein n=1 Tax=Mycoplasmopsis alligatoris TaxID=47687 RepID=UPI0002FCD965|nr:hypothetical protein [Mycoplasmopsis alligatoris]